MTFAPGTRLGAYEIVALIGAGGMGEVYRATDTRLKRDVAIKVLPEVFRSDNERLARFKREAQVLASLNDPHIAGIYGLEETPSASALILELVEGPTLADRIAQGPMPLDEALPIARQIAEALEAAHEHGIIHRDLKPANIKLPEDGTVKVLDFGLAKSFEPPTAGASAKQKPDYLSQSPTITTPALATHAGIILGTAAYMSPEQARGKAVDKRTDIWAFGCVLYEMLAGHRVFEGDDVCDTLAAILRAEPDWTDLPVATPPAIRRLLHRCLNKDYKHRLADVADARLDLEEAVDRSASETVSRRTNNSGRRLFIMAAVGLLIGSIISGTAVWLALRTAPLTPPAIRRFALAEKEMLTTGIDFQPTEHNLAISPDGSRVAYVAGDGRLYIRSLDRLGRTEFPDLGRIRSPFFSPDGKWLAFFARGTGEIKKVSVTGGPPMTITTASGNPRGGTWGSDGTIVFFTFGERGLWRVSSGGGKPLIVAKPAEDRAESYIWPHFLPGSRAVLFALARSASSSGLGNTQVAVLNLDSGHQKVLVESGSHPQYLNSGHLLYSNGGSLFAVAFDANRLEVRGEPTAVLEGVQSGSAGLSYAAIANDGTLVYLPGGEETAANRSLVWVDRQGREEIATHDLQPYGFPRVSPDGFRVAVQVEANTDSHILVHDLVRKTSMRLTFDKTAAIRPFWTPDGRSILFRGELDGLAIYRKASDGSGAVEKLTTLSGDGSPTSFSPDGKTLIFNSFGPSTNRDIWALNLSDKKVRQLISDPGSQGNGVLSPNGRWLAYSDEIEGYIVVTPFPDVSAGRWQISPAGSKWPTWSRDGRELFYVSGEPRTMMALPVEPSESAFKWGTPKALFPTPYFNFEGHTGARNYDLSADGRRFLVVKNPEGHSQAPPLVVVENWFEELKQRVPVK